MDTDLTAVSFLCGGGVFLVSSVVALAVYIVVARARVPLPRVDYLREPPDQLHPALVGAVWRGGPVGETEVAATLMDLTDRGIVSMKRVPMTITSTLGPTQDRDVTQWTLDRSKIASLDSLDAGLVAFLFDTVARDDTVTVDELRWQAHERRTEYRRALLRWVALVDAEARRRDLLRTGRPVVAPLLYMWAALSTLAVGTVSLAAPTLWPFLLAVCANVLLTAAAHRIPRRTVQGALVRDRYRALRDFLRDFSDLERIQPEQLVLWRHYLVLAVVLDVSQDMAATFAVARPSFANDPRTTSLIEWLSPSSHTPSPAEELRSLSNRR